MRLCCSDSGNSLFLVPQLVPVRGPAIRDAARPVAVREGAVPPASVTSHASAMMIAVKISRPSVT